MRRSMILAAVVCLLTVAAPALAQESPTCQFGYEWKPYWSACKMSIGDVRFFTCPTNWSFVNPANAQSWNPTPPLCAAPEVPPDTSTEDTGDGGTDDETGDDTTTTTTSTSNEVTASGERGTTTYTEATCKATGEHVWVQDHCVECVGLLSPNDDFTSCVLEVISCLPTCSR